LMLPLPACFRLAFLLVLCEAPDGMAAMNPPLV
jgi:hypothetical protein